MEAMNEESLIRQPGPGGQQARARAIAGAGSLQAALDRGLLPRRPSVSLSEGLVLGLLRQGVRKYLAIFGHGSTDLGDVLRIYTEAGVTQVFNFRNEVEMAHAGTALAWVHGETCAVVTSIGPGALQAMAGSLAAASNGVGVYHIYGDETTHGEGYNMQQVPKPQQHLFGQMTAVIGQSYVLHTPQALRDALRRGTQCVHHPFKAGPFYLLLPLNTQPQVIDELNLAALPGRLDVPRTVVADDAAVAAGRRAAASPQPHRDEGRRWRSRLRRGSARTGRGGRGGRGSVAGLDRRAAGRASAEHACGRQQGLHQRQPRDGTRRTAARRRLARRMPGGLLGRRLSEGAGRDQHQCRPRRRGAL